VDTSVPAVTVTGNVVVGQATRKDRRLYVGNLPMGAGLTEKQLSEFISTAMKQRGMMPMNGADPVLSVWLSPEGTYAFVEFHTVDYANLSLGLNGINLLTSPLRISRPNNYQPTVGGAAAPPGFEPTRLALPPGAVPAVATGQDAASLALAAAAALAGGAPLSIPGLAAMPGLAAALLPVATSRIISCSNMLTPDELAQEVERDGLKEDVAEECQRFGTILDVKVPASHNPDCCAYVKFDSVEAATQALRSLSGRKFDGRTVGVLSVEESVFDALIDDTAR
jgi:splicing factor U2AF subunit